MNLANNKLVKTTMKHGGELVKYLSKNSPTILTGCAVAGAFMAVGLAIKATKPALEHIEDAKIDHRDRIIIPNGDEREDLELTQEEIDSIPLKPLEVVQATWKDYIPTAIALAGTTACVIGAHSISAKRTAAMAALYTMSESALKEYKDKAVEVVGKGKANKIQEAVDAEKVMRGVTASDGQFIETGHGTMHCFEPYTSRPFKCDLDYIRRVINGDLIYQINQCGESVSLNDYFYAIGLPGIKNGDESGWSVDNPLDLHLTSSLLSDGTAVTTIGFINDPVPFYRHC